MSRRLFYSNFSAIDFAEEFKTSRPRLILVFFHKNLEDFMELHSIAKFNEKSKQYRFDIDKIYEQVNELRKELEKITFLNNFEIEKNENSLKIRFSTYDNNVINIKELLEQNLKLYDDPNPRQQQSWNFSRDLNNKLTKERNMFFQKLKKMIKTNSLQILNKIKKKVKKFSQIQKDKTPILDNVENLIFGEYFTHVLTIRGDIDLKNPTDINILPRRKNKQTLQLQKKTQQQQYKKDILEYVDSIYGSY